MKKLVLILVGIFIPSALFIGCSNNDTGSIATHNQQIVDSSSQNTISNNQPEKVIETVDIEKLKSIFGFADETGKYIIVYSNYEDIDKPEEINKAIGDNGKILDIEFFKIQDANENDNNRQSMYNFGNIAGYIYQVTQGSAVQDRTYYFFNENDFNIGAVIQSKEVNNIEIDENILRRIEEAKQRKVNKGWVLSEIDSNKKICLIVFERAKDEMLASIVFTSPEKIVFKDYPAQYDQSSTWVVDDNGEISPEMFKILFLAQSDEGVLLGISWLSPEGENTYFLHEKNNIFEELGIETGRYWAPE